MKYHNLFVVVLVFGLILAACSPQATPQPTPVLTEESMVAPTPEPTEAPMEEPTEAPQSPTIVDIAVEDGRFTTLVQALQSAGLVETLQGEGPFTVFAPTDDAFAALPEGALENLLADEAALQNVLLYHVVEGSVLAADVVGLDGQSVETVSGEPIQISVEGDAVMINNAQVVITDIETSNGVIHVVDSVLLPPSMEQGDTGEEMMTEEKTIVDIAVEDGRFTTLVTALQEAGLVETLQGEGPFTVFAPTDEAFAALPEGALDGLLADKEALTNVLLYHVLDGRVMAADVLNLDGQEVETLSGDSITITIDGESVMVNDSQVIIPDIEASNGVIHVIDAVLIP